MSDDLAAAFGGSLAEFYDRYLVPMQFAPYAESLAEHVRALAPRRVLETAAGTGIVAEALARRLPAETTITATDLNQAMLDQARKREGMERVICQQAECRPFIFEQPPLTCASVDH